MSSALLEETAAIVATVAETVDHVLNAHATKIDGGGCKPFSSKPR
jgi:hypothetical protein